jgi:hypothetical protein
LLRLEPGADDSGAGVSGTSVERFAASSVAAGVSLGCAGGGWQRFTIGLRELHPEDAPTQSAQRAMRTKTDFGGLEPTDIDSVEILKGGPAS